MPHQFTSYIMVQSILMTRSIPSRHLLFDHLTLLCCMGILANCSENFLGTGRKFQSLIWYQSRFPATTSSLGSGSIFPINALGNPFPAAVSRLLHPVNPSKEIAETIKTN